MKKWKWMFLFLLVFVIESQVRTVYGFWTDKIDAKVTLTVVHTADIAVLDEIDPELGEIDLINDLVATDSNAGVTE